MPHFARSIKPFEKAKLPLHLVLGNHDRRDKFLAAFPEMKFLPIDGEKPPSKLVSIWETPGRTGSCWIRRFRRVQTGEFGQAQLAWLAKALDARADKPATDCCPSPSRSVPQVQRLDRHGGIFEGGVAAEASEGVFLRPLARLGSD